MEKILREGRKFNLSLWLSSQKKPKGTFAKLADQASTQVYFNMGAEANGKTARMLATGTKQKESLYKTLSELSRGQFLIRQDGGKLRMGTGIHD